MANPTIQMAHNFVNYAVINPSFEFVHLFSEKAVLISEKDGAQSTESGVNAVFQKIQSTFCDLGSLTNYIPSVTPHKQSDATSLDRQCITIWLNFENNNSVPAKILAKVELFFEKIESPFKPEMFHISKLTYRSEPGEAQVIEKSL